MTWPIRPARPPCTPRKASPRSAARSRPENSSAEKDDAFMLIKGNFGQLDDLAAQIMNTVGKVQQEMDTWRTTSGATANDWLDRAGGQFTEVSQAWHQVSTAQQSMLEALRGGVI